jgi:hypothetical protein
VSTWIDNGAWDSVFVCSHRQHTIFHESKPTLVQPGFVSQTFFRFYQQRALVQVKARVKHDIASKWTDDGA